MIKIELERAFRGVGLKLSLIIGMIITIEHYIRKCNSNGDRAAPGL